MSDFKELQNQLQQARNGKDQARAELFEAREQVNRVEAKLKRQDRTFIPADPSHQRLRRALEELRSETEEVLKERERAYAQASETERELSLAFFRFTDPREHIKLLSDEFPFLLLPVRIETRFKTITIDGRPRRQLLARIYPDDCSVDSFDPALSESEVRAARLFWIEMWKAGGIEDQRRAAWRALAGELGLGRAAWATQNYRPLNAEPVKAKSEDVTLVIVAEAPLTREEEPAAAAFWKAVWLADGDKTKEGAARATLEAALGEPRAAEIIAQYRPVNPDEKPPSNLKKSACVTSVEFLILPAPEDAAAKQPSRHARVNTLPDRFALVGYNGGQKIFESVGRQIPSPLNLLADKRDSDTGPKDGASDETLWMTDFDRAVECGVGFKVDLIESQWRNGFDRLIAVGIRLSADELESKRLVESLIDNHFYSHGGFSLLPQGAPAHKNGGDDEDNGSNFGDDFDDGFNYFFKNRPRFEIADDWFGRRDGQWLAEQLGIDPAALEKAPHAEGRDQIEARAMNVALWPATFGYWMETMMNPLFDERDVEATRWFFTHFVSGRGAVPAIRVGDQPYGILPTTAFSRIRWISPDGFKPVDSVESPRRALQFMTRLADILKRMSADWQNMSNNAPFVGKPGDAHQTLLDVLGLHSGSVEYYQRYAESRLQLFNRLNLDGFGDALAAIDLSGEDLKLLGELGYKGKATPEMLEKFFHASQNLLRGPLIDDRPLSETEPIRGYTEDYRGYISWLIDAARTSLETLRLQTGFADDGAPNALLYLLLRHALTLGYWDAALRLRLEAGVCAEADLKNLRREAPFIHIQSGQGGAAAEAGESRWSQLFRAEPTGAGASSQPVHQHISKIIAGSAATRQLDQQIKALEQLKDAPTARLERALSEHLDCCSYRLDAWQSGIVNYKLAAMRYQKQTVRGEQRITARQGLYIGAYGWLEEVRPANKQLPPMRLDPRLDKVFNRTPDDHPRTDQPLLRDQTNGGYIHAPSLDHAAAVAILRSGYLANATPANPQAFSINLSSERVRSALSILEGVRAGQRLGALLGYQFERGLRDAIHGTDGIEGQLVSEIIFRLRIEFPLQADRGAATTNTGETEISPAFPVPAFPVMDGLSLINHIKSGEEKKTYPFGKSLPPATPPLIRAIDAEAHRLLEIHDAVADMAMAEGVYQAVQGKFDRVAATLEAFSDGLLPPEPEVIQTPSGGVRLTHRVGLLLESGLTLTGSPVPEVAMTPRAKAEPALNKWLAAMLPAPGEVGCPARFFDAETGEMIVREVTQKDLKLQPIDLLYLLRTDGNQATTELDERVLKHVIQAFGPRLDRPVTILHKERLSGEKVSFFELGAQINSLRAIALNSRPLRPTDVSTAGVAPEGEARQDETIFIDKNRIVAAKIGLGALHSSLVNFHSPLAALLADVEVMRNQIERHASEPEINRDQIDELRAELEFRRDQLFANVDDYVDQVANMLSTAGLYSVPQNGWGFAFQLKGDAFADLLNKVGALVARWEGRLNQYNRIVDEYDALQPSPDDQKKFDLLRKAHGLLFTKTISRQPSSPAVLKSALDLKLEKFVKTLDDFRGLLKSPGSSLAMLLDDLKVLLPVDDYDHEGIDVEETERRILILAAEVAEAAKTVAREIEHRIKAADERVIAHDNAATAASRALALQAAARILLGENFQIIPEYNLPVECGVEWEKALASSGELLAHLIGDLNRDFPVDEWLYGVARIREKMRHWELAATFTEAFGKGEARLDPIQLPFKEGDRWLALKFPDDCRPGLEDGERLLYTAHYAAPFRKNARLCGLLIDEWTEVIPDTKATTGVAFQFDRPNAEAPQSMLLVTSPDFSGSWSWIDLVSALNETLDWTKRRAVEPAHMDSTPYAQFLPATGAAAMLSPISIALSYSANNDLHQFLNGHNDG